MALSYGQYSGTGSQTNFEAPFEYLSRTHVKVRVDGIEVPFSWVSTYTVQVTPPPANDTVVEVRRETPRDERLVAFTDGSTLVETDLNTSSLQSFFLAQEAFDFGAASMSVTEDGSYSAGFRRISNVADPVGNQDVVTKSWATGTVNTNVSLAVVAKDTAVAARVAAETARDQANSHRANALASANAADASKVTAVAAKDTTVAAQTDVTTKTNTVTTKHTEVGNWYTLVLQLKAEVQTLKDQAQAARDQAVTAAPVPTGVIAAFLDGTVPSDWLPLEGQAVSRTGATAALFARYGTKYGAGNGTTTFNLPDTRGEWLRGWDNARGVDPSRVLGSFQDWMVGPHVHGLVMDAVPDHTHPMTFGAYYGMNSGSGRGWCRGDSGGSSTTLTTGAGGGHTPTGTVQQNTGSENRTRNLAVRWCVKL